MNIESTSLSSLAPTSGTVESASPPLVDGSVSSEGFSGTLVAQIELLNNMKAGESSPLQVADLTGLEAVNTVQGVAGLPVVKTDMPDFSASLLSNELPSAYKINNAVDHEAALAAVTDTFKYITGVSVGEKPTVAEQNMKDMIATTVPVGQSIEDVVATAVAAEEIPVDVVAGVERSPVNMPTGVERSPVNMIAGVEQSPANAAAGVEQGMKGVVIMNAPLQMDLKPTSDKSVKKPVEGESRQISGVEDNSIAGAGLASIIVPMVMPVEQGHSANNLTPADAIKEDVLSAFIKPSSADAKQNQPTKASDDVLQSEAVFRLPGQDKQDINLKYFDNAGAAEKTGRLEQQVLSVEGEKVLSRVGADTTPLSRAIVDNKADVPPITKPLSHPEWSKDLGERIVWMSSRAIPAAEIRLNPEHLGPISVRVNVADDQTTVAFTAQHAATREAIEASIPRLREMMGAQQLNLVDVNVFQGTASDQGRSQAQNFSQTADGRWQGGAGVAVNEVDDVEQEIESGQAVVTKGLLSIYA